MARLVKVGRITLVYNSGLLRFFPSWVEAFAWKDQIHIRSDSAVKGLIVHECVHVRQFRRFGTLGFVRRYLWWSIKHGYAGNPLEIEARLLVQDAAQWSAAEVDAFIANS